MAMDRVAGELGEDFDAGGRGSFLSVRAKSTNQEKKGQKSIHQ